MNSIADIVWINDEDGTTRVTDTTNKRSLTIYRDQPCFDTSIAIIFDTGYVTGSTTEYGATKIIAEFFEAPPENELAKIFKTARWA